MRKLAVEKGGLPAGAYPLMCLLLLASALLCVCAGSVSIDPLEALRALFDSRESSARTIIFSVRLPRVLCAALTGAALSLGGAAAQGLLRNPLADGSTLGVSSGASLGAVLAIAFGISVPGLPAAGTMGMAMLFAFLSLAAILALTLKIDRSLSSSTMILVGVVFTMFVNSIISLVITFAGEKVRSITFWTMGSLASSNYPDALALGAALLASGALLLCRTRELDALCISADNARHIGVNVKQVRLEVMICISVLVGVCVSSGGTIGFVGLIVPHMTRILTGPAHTRLLPASAFSGAVFLMLADLVSRTALRPLELPVGVVTSFVGAVVFVYIFYNSRKERRSCSK